MKYLVAYITAKYPDAAFSVDLALALAQNGVDAIELGVPFSDPVADGPIIEKANYRSLKGGFKLRDLFEISAQTSLHVDTLWMGYFNPFYRYGIERLLIEAKRVGVSGLIIPDLPHEEFKHYAPLFAAHHLANITFVAPTDGEERIKEVVRNAQKFIYLVAYAGITGARKAESLQDTIESIRRHAQTPIYVGFGVNEQSAKAKAEGVDGVIVGSAFIEVLLREDLSWSAKIERCAQMARHIKAQINK